MEENLNGLGPSSSGVAARQWTGGRVGGARAPVTDGRLALARLLRSCDRAARARDGTTLSVPRLVAAALRHRKRGGVCVRPRRLVDMGATWTGMEESVD